MFFPSHEIVSPLVDPLSIDCTHFVRHKFIEECSMSLSRKYLTRLVSDYWLIWLTFRKPHREPSITTVNACPTL